ncbi:hypothetical protein [Thermocatellispora tengchongensis]|uniref:hypothetical protein n=1 Tax=Thermocatellispora tengchongensis TaxID=1073253 RepID=UPI0036423EFA
MSQSAKKVLWIVFGAQVLWSLPIGLFFVWRWLAFDDPERSYICSGSRSSGKVCTDGETTNMALGIVFSVIGVIFLVVTLLFLTSWLRRRARESFLRTHGARGSGS